MSLFYNVLATRGKTHGELGLVHSTLLECPTKVD